VNDCCEYYQEGMDAVNAPIHLLAARNPDQRHYPGKPFEYCPWCGAKTKKEDIFNDIASQR